MGTDFSSDTIEAQLTLTLPESVKNTRGIVRVVDNPSSETGQLTYYLGTEVTFK